jgi:aminoglycoside phosphotransferase (APT) family kinase protein
MSDIPGLDLARFAGWFSVACPGEIGGPLGGELLAGGKSNLTYRVTDGTRSWVVRRPPLGHVLATAHDMRREYQVISALRDTGVPVPLTYALCEDTGVLGAPFYVMSTVDGTAYRTAGMMAALGPDRTRAIAQRMVDTLAALHSVDYRAVGLESFGRPEGFLARQVRRWKKQLDASRSREIPGIDELHALLAAGPPDDGPATIVHGDYRLDNLLVGADDQVAAVVDWEMATIADPLTDVGLLLVYHRLGELGDGPLASRAPGYPSEADLLDRYAARSGRDLSDLGFHIALASFKLAVIMEGIHYRYIHGQTVGVEFDEDDALGERLVAAGLSTLKERGLHGLRLRRQDRVAAGRTARLHGFPCVPGGAGLPRAARRATGPVGVVDRARAGGAARGGPGARAVEPVPARHARRGPDEPAVRAAGGDHRAFGAPGAGRAELLGPRYREHGGTGAVRLAVAAGAVASAAAGWLDPLFVRDDRAGRGVIGRHEHRHVDHPRRR